MVRQQEVVGALLEGAPRGSSRTCTGVFCTLSGVLLQVLNPGDLLNSQNFALQLEIAI